MNKINDIVMSVAISLLLTGCVSSSSSSAKLEDWKTYPNCSDEFMNAPVNRMFELPQERAPSLVRDKAKLCGRWRKNVISNVKNSDKPHRLVMTYNMSYAEELVLRRDGSYALQSGTGTNERGGTWSYSGNTLALTIDGETIRYRLTWYDDNEFAARMEDPMKGMSKPGANARRWYDDEGCLRMMIVLDGDVVSQTVLSPEVFVRMPGNPQ